MVVYVQVRSQEEVLRIWIAWGPEIPEREAEDGRLEKQGHPKMGDYEETVNGLS